MSQVTDLKRSRRSAKRNRIESDRRAGFRGVLQLREAVGQGPRPDAAPPWSLKDPGQQPVTRSVAHEIRDAQTCSCGARYRQERDLRKHVAKASRDKERTVWVSSLAFPPSDTTRRQRKARAAEGGATQ